LSLVASQTVGTVAARAGAAGQTQLVTATIRPFRTAKNVPSSPGTPVIMARSTATVLLDLDPDCTHLHSTGYVEVGLTGANGKPIQQRIDLPLGLSLPALIASFCASTAELHPSSAGQR
jgi:hypothetical protein